MVRKNTENRFAFLNIRPVENSATLRHALATALYVCTVVKISSPSRHGKAFRTLLTPEKRIHILVLRNFNRNHIKVQFMSKYTKYMVIWRHI